MSNIEDANKAKRDRIETWKKTFAKGATDEELAVFFSVCEKTGLSPETRQIHLVRRWDNQSKGFVATYQTGIDGFRLIAERTGKRNGEDGPYWLDKDGQWLDYWINDYPPLAAKLSVFKKGEDRPYTGVARFSSYAQTTKAGELTSFWQKMPDVMIAKVVESICLRKAFPQELSGLYTHEEMAQASESIIEESPRTITQTEQINLFKFLSESGVEAQELKSYLQVHFNLYNTKMMNIDQYNETVKWLSDRKILLEMSKEKQTEVIEQIE
jgi:phage recombination protein Bet